ncbi:MAG: hypothetical protein ISR57_05450 [Bacteroidales bacterium]|nr:hypothetical protein [Bacteroidota bacterium]MBL6950076.1 hypothetical protein [Bacteroidales bacterium]
MKEKKQEQKKYSPEVEEILHRRSGFIVRNGILFLAIFFALLLVATNFIKYPEQLKAPITFTQEQLVETDEIRGEIILTADAASLIKAGQPVSISLKTADDILPDQFTGRIYEIKPVNDGTYYKLSVTSLPENIPSGVEGTAIIYSGEISLFSKILNPVFAIFRYD